MNDDILTIDAVARRLEVNRETVLRWIRSGKLRASKIGTRLFVFESAVVEMLQAHEVRR